MENDFDSSSHSPFLCVLFTVTHVSVSGKMYIYLPLSMYLGGSSSSQYIAIAFIYFISSDFPAASTFLDHYIDPVFQRILSQPQDSRSGRRCENEIN
jgi:hypothetical protein